MHGVVTTSVQPATLVCSKGQSLERTWWTAATRTEPVSLKRWN